MINLNKKYLGWRYPGIVLLVLGIALPVHATTKGLNQIVTPDIQPLGVLSTSIQGQNPAIGNSEQLQLELGLAKNFEAAVFQGFNPGQTTLALEYGIVQSKSFALSTGIVGIERHSQSQPFLEGGYYQGKKLYIAGIQRQGDTNQGVFGFGYQATPAILVTFDYITGKDNFSTAGATLALTKNLSFNPAIYRSNESPHKTYAYGVLSWITKLW